MKYDFDLFVIGGGSGGVAAARRAASHGAKVALCEADKVGGTCVIRGCVPKKLLMYSASYNDLFHDAKSFGWDVKVDFNLANLINNKNQEIDRLNNIYINMLQNSNVKLFTGYASFIDNHSIQIGNQTFTAEKILIATGSKPFLPNIEGLSYAITSNEALNLIKLPKKLAIIGGGYIALEFASIFNGFGTEVDLIIRSNRMLKEFDHETVDFLYKEIHKKGVNIKFECEINTITKVKEILKASFKDGSSTNYEQIIYATGRVPNIDKLNVEKLGIKKAKNGAIITNDKFETNINNIYAIGDVTDKVNLTPVAIYEGRLFADNNFNNQNKQPDYQNIATAIFTQPQMACVGFTEAQLKIDYDIYKTSFRPMKFSLSKRDEKCFIKLLVNKNNNRIIGAHMVGNDAAEIMQILAVCIKAGITKEQFDETIAIHPTSAEEFVLMKEKSN